jgi:hypothetical protein
MAGTLTIDTLKASSGVLATQNGMTGIAKAWVYFAGSTGTITGSFNVSSVTRNSTGYYTVNFTTAMPNANYSAVASCSQGGSAPKYCNIFDAGGFNSAVPTTSSYGIGVINYNAAAYYDAPYICSTVFSS